MSVKAVFTQTYEQHIWGGTADEYVSGSGSSESQAAGYAAVVKPCIAKWNISTLVDLGCGDFTVGKALTSGGGLRYIGIDVVDGLIRKNQTAYGGGHAVFLCLDMLRDPLPDGDLCLIRQVLQHLSNSQIIAVLQKTKQYRRVLVTEHYPAPSVRCRPNLDKPHGPDTRIFDGSAVYLEQPPFNVPLSQITLIHEVETQGYLVHKGEMLRTFLIENRPNE